MISEIRKTKYISSIALPLLNLLYGAAIQRDVKEEQRVESTLMFALGPQRSHVAQRPDLTRFIASNKTTLSYHASPFHIGARNRVQLLALPLLCDVQALQSICRR